jgi:hypothetical protein
LQRRTWFAKVSAAAPELLTQHVLPEELRGAAAELAPYLDDSLGNPTRIDYGTGHETTFIALLCCLAKLGVLTEADLQVDLCARLQVLRLSSHLPMPNWIPSTGPIPACNAPSSCQVNMPLRKQCRTSQVCIEMP